MPTNAIALSRLLIAERTSLVRWVASIIGSEPAAEDVAQSLYIKVQTVEDHPPIVNKRSFLFRLASNLAIDHIRSARRHDALFAHHVNTSHVPSTEPSAESRLLDQEKVRRLAAVVETMPLRCRQVFVLIKFDELSVAQTATRLGITQDMVRKHIRHALQICHQALTGDQPA
ncbi:ECF subfamily RNA polymerase sigma-24 subunit [Novosphingobium sp. Rr 2-17]|uniref:RNA polymerase sigma factor n=1 Tax=Novosphingobium sp. Rr 2-17 TaxID=555793 RepID=UPI0002697BE5|nr:RNA polymerase sigma factor [Novosphingobium sp. Rr 2-17]EIZ77143.1 ECF subfamily RNA polymerase sigma-24 subunit [Novosphingobium sp. Rr 2-17]